MAKRRTMPTRRTTTFSKLRDSGAWVCCTQKTERWRIQKTLRNPARHGLASIHPVLIGEDSEPFRRFLKALTDELQPVGFMEIMLVEQIADASWRRRRITMLEQSLFDILRGEVKPEIKKKYDVINRQATLHLISCKDANDQLGKYYRYDARFERSF